MRRIERMMGAVAVLLVAGVCGCRGGAQGQLATEEVVCIAEDGVETRGVLYKVDAPNPPGLLLVHAMGSGPHEWESLARRAQQQGYLCLAMRMRGHDAVSREGRGYRQFKREDWLDVLKDIAGAARVLREKGADPQNLVVGGASLGANLALHHAVRNEAVLAVILLSPGLEYQGIETETAIEELGRRPVLLMCTKGDAYSASSCRRLKARASGLCELREYEGASHGTDILNSSASSVGQILLWLKDIVGTQPAA